MEISSDSWGQRTGVDSATASGIHPRPAIGEREPSLSVLRSRPSESGSPTESQQAIVRELYLACEGLGAKSDLLSAIGSWGEVSEEEVLAMLRDFNRSRR